MFTKTCLVLYVKPPARIGTPGSAEMLATARTPSTAGKPPIAERPPATASLKGTAETLATPGTPAIAGRPATVTHQELKGRAGHSLIFSRFAIRSPLNFFPWITDAHVLIFLISLFTRRSTSGSLSEKGLNHLSLSIIK